MTLKTGGSMRKNLIALRKDKSRICVAKDLGITPQMLGAIERGSRNPSRNLTKRLAKYYETTTDEIIFFVEDRDEMSPDVKA